MCLVTIVVWALLVGALFALGALGVDDKALAVASLVAMGLGVLVPPVINLWRPILLGWSGARRRLQERLLAQGVMNTSDLQRNPRFVRLREVVVGGRRRTGLRPQSAFLLVGDGGSGEEGIKLSILGEHDCLSVLKYRIVPGDTGQCSRCWVIWACGGEGFRLRAWVDGRERDFLVECREGRNLWQAAKSTEMLEELLAADAANQSEEKEEQAGGSGDEREAPAPQGPAERGDAEGQSADGPGSSS